MRSSQNPSGSIAQSVGVRNAGNGSVQVKSSPPQVPVDHRMPVEWLDSGKWRLPSGMALAEFALQAGFLAPLLFRTNRLGKGSRNGSSEIRGGTAQLPGKQFGNEGGR